MLVENGQGLTIRPPPTSDAYRGWRFGNRAAGRWAACSRLSPPAKASAGFRRAARSKCSTTIPIGSARKYGYFGDIETTLEPGPSDATATVKLVDQKQADMGYPSPGVFSLGLEQGIPLVSVFDMGGSDVFDFAFRKGENAEEHQGPRRQDHRARQRRLAVDLRPDAVCGRSRC